MRAKKQKKMLPRKFGGLAANALIASELRYRRLFESAKDGILILNAETGMVVDVNPYLTNLLGLTKEQFLRKRVWALGFLKSIIANKRKFAELQLNENVHYDNMPLETIDGRRIDVEFVSNVYLVDGAKVIQCNIRNITERKREEAALQLSEKRFKAVFEQAAVGVMQVDANTGRFIKVNNHFCRIVGRSREEMENLTYAAITHPQDLSRDLETGRQLRAGVIRESTREKRYLRKDGSEVWITLTLSAMWQPGEPPDYFIAVVQDITERKRLEDQLLQAQKMEAVGTLAGGLAHDFNNILTAICGYTELSLVALKKNPVVRENLSGVLLAARRATDLVQQILTFSRQHPQERKPIRLEPIVAEGIALLRAIVPPIIEFKTSFAADAPTVLADATQIHQIMLNLGTNASYAMQNSVGLLQVKLERCEVDAALAATQPRLQPGVYARMSVSDTGSGMDQATLRRIFEPFFTTKPPGEGTGLGLAVVHGIMDSHNGAVTVHSQPGKGTVFRLYFPAYAGEATMAATEQGPAPRGHGERILVVDDDELVARLVQKTLASLGYKVEAATQPETALAMVRADPQRFSLVLTDQTMPKMSGLVLASQLRQIRPGLPVILTTAHDPWLTSERLEAAGIRQLLVKPSTLELLATAVHAALPVRSSVRVRGVRVR